MPTRSSKNQSPQINFQARKRGRPAGRRNSTTRADRQEACRRVAEALVQGPLASVKRLSELAWPEIARDGDEKARKRTHERTRRALADLTRCPGLAGSEELTERVLAALAARESEAERRRQERERERQEREKRRQKREAERKERMKELPARVLLCRLLAIPEVREEIARVVRAKRRFTIVGLEDERKIWWTFALTPDQVPETAEITHFRPGSAGEYMTSSEATWRSNVEINVQRKISCLLTIPFRAAWSILTAVKKLRKARRKGDTAELTAAQEELRRAVREGLNQVGWADPENWSGQELEAPGAREAREANTVRKAGTWPLLHGGMVDLTLPSENWPEPWRGRALQAPEDVDKIAELLKAGKLEFLYHHRLDDVARLALKAAGASRGASRADVAISPGGGKIKSGGSRTDKVAAWQATHA